MKCIEAQQLVKPYIEGQLSDKQLEHFLDHVEHCPECYEELEIYFSIYETIGSADKDQKEDYDFEGKLIQNIKNSRRYLQFRKAYRFFRFAVIILAELLLVCTIITGIELKRNEGSKGTTIYRMIYGKDGEIKIDYLSESEAEEYLKERESEWANPKKQEQMVEQQIPSQTEGPVTEAEHAEAKKPKTGADKNE